MPGPERYRIETDGGAVRLTPCPADAGPAWPPRDSRILPGYALPRHLGDLDVLRCRAYRRNDAPGGFFVVEDAHGILFTALAETNLAWAGGLSLLGRMVTYPRYAADIFEDQEDDG